MMKMKTTKGDQKADTDSDITRGLRVTLRVGGEGESIA